MKTVNFSVSLSPSSIHVLTDVSTEILFINCANFQRNNSIFAQKQSSLLKISLWEKLIF